MDLWNISGKRQHGLAQRKIKMFVLILKIKPQKQNEAFEVLF